MEEAFPEIPKKELPVKTVVVIPARKVDSKEFLEELREFLNKSKSTWRTSGAICTEFKVDAVELHKVLCENDEFVIKVSQGDTFYTLKSKLEKEVVKTNIRKVINEEDLFALAQINLVIEMLDKTLKRHGCVLMEKSKDAFSYIVEGKSKLEAGIMHLANATKVNLGKLE